MDLYGGEASIAQVNSQTAETRALNQATTDFNNSLAEQLDQANLEQDEDRKSTLQKNIASGATSGGKLAVIGKNQKVRKAAAINAGGYKELPITREETLAREVGEERAPLTNPPAAGEAVAQRPVGTTETYTAEGRLAEQEAAQTSEVAGSVGVKSSAEVATESLAKVAGKAATVGKVGVAGLGGALDIGADVSRVLEGKSGMDVLGSNSASRIGNILNIAGSALEVGGVATGGITPWSLVAEGTGALLGLAGAITEGVGEEEASADKKEEADTDISSQSRGQSVASQVTQAVGRTQ